MIILKAANIRFIFDDSDSVMFNTRRLKGLSNIVISYYKYLHSSMFCFPDIHENLHWISVEFWLQRSSLSSLFDTILEVTESSVGREQGGSREGAGREQGESRREEQRGSREKYLWNCYNGDISTIAEIWYFEDEKSNCMDCGPPRKLVRM